MKADVINSLSNTTVSVRPAVRAALDSGIVIVVAAGNNGTPNYIADGHRDVVVAAMDDDPCLVHRTITPTWQRRASIQTASVRMPGTDSVGRARVRADEGNSFAARVSVPAMESVRRARGSSA
jgi:hypothetical protein